MKFDTEHNGMCIALCAKFQKNQPTNKESMDERDFVKFQIISYICSQQTPGELITHNFQGYFTSIVVIIWLQT